MSLALNLAFFGTCVCFSKPKSHACPYMHGGEKVSAGFTMLGILQSFKRREVPQTKEVQMLRRQKSDNCPIGFLSLYELPNVCSWLTFMCHPTLFIFIHYCSCFNISTCGFASRKSSLAHRFWFVSPLAFWVYLCLITSENLLCSYIGNCVHLLFFKASHVAQ